jgi:hypothetical protein
MQNFLGILIFWVKFITRIFNSRIPNSEFLEKYNPEIDYYMKINRKFTLKTKLNFNHVNVFKKSGYSYDFYNIIYPFRKYLKFQYLPGDITFIPSEPSFVKSRPISHDNQNAVLLPLGSRRHLRFVSDKINFSQKHNQIVWRGAAYQLNRKKFLQYSAGLDFVNAADTSIKNGDSSDYRNSFMSVNDQLKFKFIMSLEGNDVATNLKWIMSSSSVCVMPEPKFETWFMEGCLIPDYHYIKVRSDFLDLEEKFNFYSKKPDKCKSIIANANNHCSNFKCRNLRLNLARAVVLKYNNFLIKE